MAGAHWKREKVQDHKFDFINVDDFIDNSCWRQFRYMLVFVVIIRGILVYCSDIFTAVNLLSNENPDTFIPSKGLEIVSGIKLPFDVYKYLFTGCIILGLLLLALDIRRASGIIKSRDIAYAFTSQIAARYYTVRSYPHYCFFSQINNSKKMVDDVAFFCFFTFRNWKRLLLADAPRQVINGTILYQQFRGHKLSSFFEWDEVVGPGLLYKKLSLGAMMFTVIVFAFSMISFIAAVFMYIPLVSHIQGNLKEYCCHKIDKRIDELIRKNTKSRANAAAKGGKGGKGDIAMDYMGKPTLPQVDLLDSAPPAKPAATPRNAYAKGPAPSPYSGGRDHYGHQQQHQQQQQQQQQHDYDYAYSSQGAYNPSPQQPGYTQNYNNEDYFQAKPVHKGSSTNKGNYQQQQQRGGGGGDGGFDPYAESAFTTEDAYDQYSGSQDQLHSQKSRGDYYNNSPAAQTPRGGGGAKYDDYSHLRSASPLPSQHGSDLESNHYSNPSQSYGHGGHGGHGGYGNNQYNNNQSNNGGYYQQDYSGTPQRPRRNNGGY